MKTEQPNKPYQPEYFPTAGFGSVAPPWIKADLLTTPQVKTATAKPAQPSWLWLRRQFGWHLK